MSDDVQAHLRALEEARRSSDTRYAAVTRELERFDGRLSDLHDLTLERMKEARADREDRKRTDARLFAELRRLAEQVADLKLAREVEEKTDARIQLRDTQGRETLKTRVAVVAGVVGAIATLGAIVGRAVSYLLEWLTRHPPPPPHP